MSNNGAQGNEQSRLPAISGDGQIVVYQSDSSNLVPGDTNSESDIFEYKRSGDVDIRLISLDSSGVPGNTHSSSPAVSADGNDIAFRSHSSNLVLRDINECADAFHFNALSGETVLASISSTGDQANISVFDPAVSGDGRYVAFETVATTLIPDDTNNFFDVFVHDIQTGDTNRVSVSSSGEQANDNSGDPDISSDGRYVVFHSRADNLAPYHRYYIDDIYRHDRETGITIRISVNSSGKQGNGSSYNPAISADGRYVVFDSAATNLVTGDINGVSDIFLHDTLTGETSLISISSLGVKGNSSSDHPDVSLDGNLIVFHSSASNLVPVDTNALSDIFVHDRQTGLTIMASINSDGIQTNGVSILPTISSDGMIVAFQSEAANLVLGDTNGVSDIFIWDYRTSKTQRISISWDGDQSTFSSVRPSISSNGQCVVFQSDAIDLVADDTAGWTSIFRVCDYPIHLPHAVFIPIMVKSP